MTVNRHLVSKTRAEHAQIDVALNHEWPYYLNLKLDLNRRNVKMQH